MALSTCNIDQSQRVIEQFSLEKLFRNLNINEMVSLFNRTIKNIVSNYIPHKQTFVVTEIRLGLIITSSSLFKRKKNKYKSYILSNNNP